MEKYLLDRIIEIVDLINQLKTRIYPEYNLKIGYLTVFSQNANDFDRLRGILKKEGTELVANNGYKYELNDTVNIAEEKVRIIRVRKPDIHRKELGCCDLDYSVNNYENLRKLAIEKGLDIILRRRYEMIELSTFDLNVYAYLVKDF